MQPVTQHPWDLSESEAEALQRDLARQVLAVDRLGPVTTVAGVDVAYDKYSDRLVAAVVVLDAASLAVTRGEGTSLVDGDEVIGRYLRTQDGVRPVYVSVGHRVSLETACDWVLRLAPKYRLPETTRQADHRVKLLLAGQ